MPIVVQVCLFLVFFMNYLRMVFVSSQSVVVPTSLTGRLVFSISRLWRTTRNRKWKDSKLSNEGCHRGMYKCVVYFLFTWQHGLFLEQYPLQIYTCLTRLRVSLFRSEASDGMKSYSAINLNMRRNKEKLNDLHELIASVGLSSLFACARTVADQSLTLKTPNILNSTVRWSNCLQHLSRRVVRPKTAF